MTKRTADVVEPVGRIFWVRVPRLADDEKVDFIKPALRALPFVSKVEDQFEWRAENKPIARVFWVYVVWGREKGAIDDDFIAKQLRQTVETSFAMAGVNKKTGERK